MRRAGAATKSSRLFSKSPEEQRAEALSQYLSRAHEEKLRAIQELEMKKAEEIKSLMKQLESLRSETIPLPVDPEKEQMKKEIQQLRYDISQFKQQAEIDRANAVKEVEEKMKQMYESKQQGAKTASEPAPASSESDLFDARNAHIAKAAAAGKSRWGDMENQKAAAWTPTTSLVNGASYEPVPGTANKEMLGVARAQTSAIEVPPEVAAADKGLRKEGAVGGMSLAERIAMGSNAGAIAVEHARETGKSMKVADLPATSTQEEVARVSAPSSSGGTSLYQIRNAQVAASGAAGKSRWGSLEVQKAAGRAIQITYTPASTSISSKTMETTTSTLPEPMKEPSTGRNPLYTARNARVVAAGAAGKSRWGALEVKKSSLAP